MPNLIFESDLVHFLKFLFFCVFPAADVNLFVELNFQQKDWLASMAVMVQHCHLILHFPDGTVTKGGDSVKDVILPEDQTLQPER